MNRPLSAALLLALSAGCLPSAPTPSEAQVQAARARWPTLDKEQLDSGRTLYRMACSRCHELTPPSRLTPEQWETMVARMAPRALLSEEDEVAVFQYLYAVTQPPAGAAAVAPRPQP